MKLPRPPWVQGFLAYVTVLLVVVGLPLAPALLTLLIVALVRG